MKLYEVTVVVQLEAIDEGFATGIIDQAIGDVEESMEDLDPDDRTGEIQSWRFIEITEVP